MIYDRHGLQDTCRNNNGAHKNKERIRDGKWHSFEEGKLFGRRVNYRTHQPNAVEHKESCWESYTARPAFATEEKDDEEYPEERQTCLNRPGFPLIHK